MPSTDQPAGILTGAADLIETKGLAKGDYIDNDTGRICTLGAMAVTYGLPADIWSDESPGHAAPLWDAAEVLAREIGGCILPEVPEKDAIRYTIANWSDTCDQTGVVTRLRACAEGLADGAA